jgi:hypothetical protein
MMVTIRAIADGFNLEELYYDSELCLYAYAALEVRLKEAWDAVRNPEYKDIDFLDERIRAENWFELLLALGNVSTTFKECWNNTEEALVDGLEWANQFPNISDYITYLIPNLLSQTIFINQYMSAVQQYTFEGNQTGVIYVYCIILRKVFIFPRPDVNDFDDFYTTD